MNITFLIGNGFDLGLGVRSKFRNFFPEYVKKSKNKKDDIKQLSEQIGSDYDTWSDFEIQMGRYTANFDKDNKHLYTKQFRDFQTEFVNYLKGEEEKLSFDESEKIAQMMINALTNFYSRLNLKDGSYNTINNRMINTSSNERIYNFITFNYTYTLENCLKTIPEGIVKSRRKNGSVITDKVGKIVHVHGTIDNAPIMGVNDASQIANKELAKDERFIRYLVKPTLNMLHRTNQDSDASSIISSSDIICIYGMALGATDKGWWEKVLSWLKSGYESQLVIFDYDPNFSESSQFDWIDKEDSILDKLSQYVQGTQIDVEKLRPKIHVAVHKNIFEMNLRREDTTSKSTVGQDFVVENGLIRSAPKSLLQVGGN